MKLSPKIERIWPALAVLAGVSILFGLGGCAAPGTAPEDHYYRLPAVAVEQNNSPVLKGTLAVARFTTAGLYNDRAIVYIDRRKPLEVKRYRYHYWTEVPATLLQDHLINYFRDRHFADEVVRSEWDEPAQYTIAARITRLDRVLDGKRIAVVAGLEVEYRAAGGAVQRWVYRVRATPDGTSMDATVAAFGTALERIYAQLADDISAVQAHTAA